MILYANGCSMTFGHEMGPDFDKICNEKAWPAHLGRMMGADVINESMPGGSNDRIVRVTTRYIAEYLAAGNAASDLRVAIGWTQPLRREFHEVATGKWHNFNPRNEYSAGPLTPHYCPAYCSQEEASGRFFAQMLGLQSLLEAHGIAYSCFIAIKQDRRPLPHPPACTRLLKRFYLLESSFFDWSIERGYPSGPIGHPLEEGHRDWATHLYENMWVQ